MMNEYSQALLSLSLNFDLPLSQQTDRTDNQRCLAASLLSVLRVRKNEGEHLNSLSETHLLVVERRLVT